MNVVTLLLQILSAINVLFAVAVVFWGRRNPASTWAWLLVLIFVPYVGFLLYLFVGQDSRKYRTFAAKGKRDEAFFDELTKKNFDGTAFMRNQAKMLKSARSLEHGDALRVFGQLRLNDLAFLNFNGGMGAMTQNNALTIYHDGTEKFDALIRDVDNAKQFIHILYYIYKSDELGKRVTAALTRAVRRGVEVRLLIDGMGCWNTDRGLFAEFTASGGKLAVFMPPHIARVNFRNHRKIVVIDGVIGYIGGLNVGDEYVGNDIRFGYWRDTHIRLFGDAAKSLEVRFMMDWNFCSKETLKPEEVYFPALSASKTGDMTDVRVQIVSSGPDTPRSSVRDGYAKMIGEAEKSVYIQTPYFSPDDSILQSLRIAALSGCDIRVMIPAKPDHPFVYWSSMSYLGELIEAGARCYLYKKGFVHSKFIIIDGICASVGTANMDVRSFMLNFEVNAFIYDHAAAKELESLFLKDIADCVEVTPKMYAERSAFMKMKESVSRLLSPIL